MGSKLRGTFNGLCFLVFIFLFLHNQNFQTPFLLNKPNSDHNVITTFNTSSTIFRRKTYEELDNGNSLSRNPQICTGIHQHQGYDSKCEYVKAHKECNAGGFFDYLSFFYCDCQKFRFLGYFVLAIWLLALFYLLGNTAADYFCCCLEKLSGLLKLPPTVAGVTLLPLGNGAPDVFASIAAFTGRDSGDVGLNSVLGGAVFVTCVVVGVISICIAEKNVRIDKKCFIRDIVFFLIAVVGLLVILLVGKVSIGGAIAFVLIYVVYALFVGASELLSKRGMSLKDSLLPLLPVTRLLSGENSEDDESVHRVLLESDGSVPHLEAKLPHWMWSNNVAIYSHKSGEANDEEHPKYLWGWNEEETDNDEFCFSFSKLCSWLEVPLALPRRLTIPIIEEERWSKFYAVGSALFAPLLLSLIWSTQGSIGATSIGIGYLVGGLVGCFLGLLAFIYTKTDHPPQKFVFPWVLGGFVMSILWFYIIANELVALLVAFGVILSIKPSLLALTVLAWGNSMGDLMSNVAIAMNSGDGVQVAMSGSFAGPMFNILAGLGISLLIGASKKSSPYIVPRDTSLYFTLGVLVLGLLWSLVILPRNGMRPSKLLGVGLIVIYVGFLAVRASIAMSEGSVNGSS